MNSSRRKIIFIFKSFAVFTIFSFFWVQIKFEGPSRYESNHSTSYIVPDNHSIAPFSTLSQLKRFINLNNHIQTIHNEEKFGKFSPIDLYYRDTTSISTQVSTVATIDVQSNDSSQLNFSNPFIVIVVQVHDRANYLKGLINSLREVRGIEDVLLVFSHDMYDEKINQLLRSIDFCRFTQIFYPYSIQLFPSRFPGSDARDCPRNMKKTDAQKINCLNAKDADSYGHYREAKYTQTKHHWVWKGNFVMNELRVLDQSIKFHQKNKQMLKRKQILFLFLEEDHLVVPDILHVLKLLNDIRNEKCSVCEILNLGIYTKNANFAKYGNKFTVNKWFGLNMGMVLDRVSWSRLVAHSKAFCSYDDYNWDWSMKMVSDRHLDKSLRSLGVASPRVFHVGECGVHFKGKSCKQLSMTRRALDVIKSSSDYLFPSSLVQHLGGKKSSKTPAPNGGWSDTRDHQLCLHLFNSSLSNPIVTS